MFALAASVSATSSVSAKNSRPQTQVKVFGNLAEQADGTATITGAIYGNTATCLKGRLITLYDASGNARGTAVTILLNGKGLNDAGYWEVHPSSGTGFTVGTYHATAAKKRLAHGVLCRFGRSPDTAVAQ
jgi:hypothetical protein